ncbi:hypothetical protein KSP39_PZI012214 [Platanthera zijinensis]|uniref:Protein FAR1-RELATED SEQUENCE n=1 Tax=Platanthera zijinensis TaxID=2320716 RepID=A0AAP0BEP7_9ASPA
MSFNKLISRFSTLHSKALEFVSTTWLDPYKEYFVSAWIDKFFHFGNSSTNRVEGGHSLLQKFLEVSIGNLTTIRKTFDQMINLQYTDIKRSFGESCIKN